MKKYAILLIVSVIFVPSASFAQRTGLWGSDGNDSPDNLVLTHPTVSNLKKIAHLVDKNLINLENYTIIGIYHEDEQYEYESSRNYVDTASLSGLNIYLHGFSDTIHPELLYKQNSLTDDFRKIFTHSRGVIFFGGPDLPPEVYDEKTSLHTSVYDPYRHYFELSFLFHLLGGYQNDDLEPLLSKYPDYLIYGFCLGMQTMNVAAGGTLIQDIPVEVYNLHFVEDVLKLDPDRLHRNYYNRLSMEDDLLSGHFHRIHFKSAEFFNGLDLDNTTPSVYSNHHQAVKNLGKGFQVKATSIDGEIVEMIQHKKYGNVIGVQFHPEAPFLYDAEEKFRLTPDDSVSFTGPQILQETHSMEFHRKFWENFQQRLNE
ncbi:MAG: gamma-glutamyl-gamma-aminobutyrate hydrolase family protein [Bacteroidales bacterium]